MAFLEELQAKQIEFSQSYKLIAAKKNIQLDEQVDFDYEDLHSLLEADHGHSHSHDYDHDLYHTLEEVEEEQPISEQYLEANADKLEGQEAAKEAGEQ